MRPTYFHIYTKYYWDYVCFCALHTNLIQYYFLKKTVCFLFIFNSTVNLSTHLSPFRFIPPTTFCSVFPSQPAEHCPFFHF